MDGWLRSFMLFSLSVVWPVAHPAVNNKTAAASNALSILDISISQIVDDIGDDTHFFDVRRILITVVDREVALRGAFDLAQT